MSHEPHLTPEAVRAALDALRAAEPLPSAALTGLLIVQQQHRAPEAVPGKAALDQTLYRLLCDEITAQLDRLRQLEGLPPTGSVGERRASTEAALKEDFARSSAELEAWSLLYHCYVRVELGLEVAALAPLVFHDPRTLRRRRAQGVARLTARLVDAERAARVEQSRLRLRLALPAALAPDLVGVGEQAARILSALLDEDPPRPVMLHSGGGVGKTALALWLAHQLIDRDAIDDVVWLQDPAAETLHARLLEGLGQRAGDADPLVALRAHAHTYRLLVVLDAAEALAEWSHFDALLDQLKAARVLVTSRVAPPAGSHAHVITLRDLDQASAFDLMERETTWQTDRPDREARFGQVWDAVGGNPLALRVAASHLHLFDAGHVAGRLGALPAGESNIFAALFHAAWDALGRDARRLWVGMALFPAAYPPTAAELRRFVDGATAALERGLVTLARRALIEVNAAAAEPHTYALARLPRAFLESLLADGAALGDMPAAAFVSAHARALAASLASGDAPAAVTFERGAHLLVHADRFGLSDLAPRLAQAVHDAAMSDGRWAAWMPVLGALPDSSGDRTTRSVWLGEAQRALGLLNEARETLQQVLSAEQTQPALWAAAALELAVVLRLGGLLDRARATAGQARRAFIGIGDKDGTARAVTELAQIELDAGRPEAALHLLEGVHAQSSRQARIRALSGNAFLALGRVEEALAAHWQALELAQQGEHRSNQARALVNLGRAQLAAGDLIEAEASFDEALGIMVHTRDAIGSTRTRANLAVLYAERGHHRRAIDLLNAVLKEQDAFGDGQGAALSRRNLAEIRLRAAETALKRGQTRAALRHLEAGRAMYDQLGLHDQGDAIRRMASELSASRDVS